MFEAVDHESAPVVAGGRGGVAGRSSLGHFRTLPMADLKIDRTLVRALAQARRRQSRRV